jgi:hypothetical protein
MDVDRFQTEFSVRPGDANTILTIVPMARKTKFERLAGSLASRVCGREEKQLASEAAKQGAPGRKVEFRVCLLPIHVQPDTPC